MSEIGRVRIEDLRMSEEQLTQGKFMLALMAHHINEMSTTAEPSGNKRLSFQLQAHAVHALQLHLLLDEPWLRGVLLTDPQAEPEDGE